MYVYPEYKKKKKNWLLLLFTFLVAVSGSYLVQTFFTSRRGSEGNIEKLSNEVEVISKESNKSQADIIENAMKSVVGISMLKANEESLFDVSLTEKWGLGTGIIVSDDGYILTNQHLARKENTNLIVNFENGESVQGKVVWCNESIDLAIVKVKKSGLNVAKLGNSDDIRVGDNVLAIGNPLGVDFQRTTTSGIISGKNRTLSFEEDGKTIFMEDMIQTDASINSGNSGGPLINASGEVIGINTIKITSAEGIGFAIPINLIKPIIEKFSKDGYFEECYLGMFLYDKEIIKYVNSSIKIENGVYITNISKSGPAEKAGLKVGDIILNIDGLKLDKVTDLRRYIYSKKTKDVVTLIINRNNEILNIKLELGVKY